MSLSSRLLAAALSLCAAPAFAAAGDLVLPDAFFLAKFDRFICRGFDEAGVAAPEALREHDVRFEALRGDRMLIQFLVTANFTGEGGECRYSALMTRAPRNSLKLVQSKAFGADPAVDCAAGQAELDAALKLTPYTHTKDPIRFIALKMTIPGAADICGTESIRPVFERQR